MTKYRWLTLIVCLMSLVFVGGSVALAAETRRETRLQIPADETVQGDLVAEGGTVELFGAVEGDLIARAGFVNQVGDVDGSVSIRAGRAELRGAVAGSVQAVGGSLNLYGIIAGNVELTGGQFKLVEGAVVAGNLIVHGGSLTIVAGAQVGGDLRGQVVSATIEGNVGQDVDLMVRRLSLAPGARVDGSLRYESRVTATVDPAAVVAGSLVRRDPADRLPAGSLLLWHTAALPRLLGILVIGAGLITISPRRVVKLADRPRRAPISTALTGLGAIVFVPMLLLTVAVFVITIPFVVIGGVVYVLACYLSMALVGLALGRVLLRRPTTDHQRLINVAALCLGAGILAAIRVIPLPFIDDLVAGGTAVIGLGVLASSGATTNLPPRAPSEERPIAGLVLGGTLSLAAICLALVALIAAVTGLIAALATASHSASFSWQVAPRQLGLVAWITATLALLITVCTIMIGHRTGRGTERDRLG